MKILITGVTGFIGQHLSKRLTNNKFEIHAIVRPSTNLGLLKNLKIKYFIFDNNLESLNIYLKKESFDGVIHLATLFQNNHTSKDIPSLIQSNILFPTILIELAVKNKISWFINTGTSWQHYQNKLYSPVNFYAATKEAFQDIAQFYFESTKIKFVTLLLDNTFGPNDTRNKILDIWYKAGISNLSLNMSPGNQVVDMIYIENVIDAYEQMISLLSKSKVKYKGQIFRISSNKLLTLRQLALLFIKVTKLKLRINWGATPYNSRQLMKPWTIIPIIPNWKPKISLRKGIKITYPSIN